MADRKYQKGLAPQTVSASNKATTFLLLQFIITVICTARHNLVNLLKFVGTTNERRKSNCIESIHKRHQKVSII